MLFFRAVVPSVALAFMACAWLACLAVPMPPPMFAYDGVAREPAGSVSLGAAAGGVASAQGLAASTGFGDTGVALQTSENVSLGVEGAAAQLGSAGAGRAHFRYNTDSDYFAIVGGIGGGTTLGSEVTSALVSSTTVNVTTVNGRLDYATLDLGLRGGWHTPNRVFEVYSSTSVAGSFPVVWDGPGHPAISSIPWFLLEAGVIVRPARWLAIGAHAWLLEPYYSWVGAMLSVRFVIERRAPLAVAVQPAADPLAVPTGW